MPVTADASEIGGDNWYIAEGALARGSLTVNGGTVTATGGRVGEDIGEGIGGGYVCSTDVIDGGTVTIDGGSTKASSIQSQPKNGKKQDVHCVSAEIEWLSVEKLRVEGLEGYGTKDIMPIDGRVYLYLPNGTHAFSLSDGTKTLHYYAIVNGRDVTVEPLELTGFFVNGIDVGQESGTGWRYENKVLHFTGSSRSYVLSGLAKNDEVQVSVDAGDTTFVLSNAVVYTCGRAALTVGQGLDGVVLGMAVGNDPGSVRYATCSSGAKCVIEVPAPGKQGFFYLMSKPAAPSDAIHAPFPIIR